MAQDSEENKSNSGLYMNKNSKSDTSQKKDQSLKARPPKKKSLLSKDESPLVIDKFKQAGEMMQSGVKKVLPHRNDTPDTWYFKLLGLSLVGLMVVVVLAGLAAFFLSLKSPETVAVPQVEGKELTAGLQDLQDYGLLGRIELRYSSDPSTKGKILEQEPRSGNAVRVGRDIRLVVSRGAMVDQVTSYVGRPLDEVTQEIRIQFGLDNPLLKLGTVTMAFDDRPQGTIISQNPVPGTSIDQAMEISFLVSRGSAADAIVVPDLQGRSYADAIEQLSQREIPFRFEQTDSESAEAGTVIAESPAPGAALSSGNTLVLQYKPKASAGKKIEGFYSLELPEYSVLVDITVKAVDETGGQTVLYKFKHLGGILSFPYSLNEGQELVVSALGRELERVRVQANADS